MSSYIRPYKRGATFTQTCLYLPDGVTAQPIDDSLQIESWVRTSNGRHQLTVTLFPDQLLYPGLYMVQGDTSCWGIGKAHWEVIYKQNGMVLPTNTIEFEVELGADSCLPLP